MTNEELVLQIQRGINVKENMEILWQKNYKFLVKMANRYSAQLDDLCQNGYYGLCETVKHYDPKRGVKFLTYAGYYIQAWFSRHTKKEMKALDVAWLDKPIVNKDGEVVAFGDCLESYVDVENEAVNSVQTEQIGVVLWPMVDKLPEKTRKVFILLYQKNMTKDEIALELGCSRNRIYQIHADGLIKLRKPENLNKLYQFLH